MAEDQVRESTQDRDLLGAIETGERVHRVAVDR